MLCAGEISKAEQDFERSRKAAEFAVTSTNLNELQRKEALTSAKSTAVQAIQARVGGTVNAFFGALTAASGGALNRPEFESRIQSEVIPLLNTHLPALEQQITQQLMSVPGMTAEEVKTNTDLLMKPLRSAVEGMQKNATRFTGIAEQLRARHGIEFARSLPVIAFLETAFGRDISTRFLELNKTQIDKLITEQANTDWANPNAQSVLMQRASMILKGELPMGNQPTDVIKTAISATRDLSEQIAKDINLLDPSSVSMAAEGLGQLGLAGNSLSVGEGENAHFNVAANLGRPTTWQAIDAMMSNPRYRDQGDRTVQVVRSGAANGLRSLTKLAETKMPSGWKLQYNKTTGRYEAVGSRGTNPSGGTRLSGGANARFGVPDFRSSAPEQAKQFEIAANNFLSILVATEKHGLEPIKGNAKQIREFHALGIVPEGAQKTKSKAKKADELTDETITNLTEALQRLPQGLATQAQLVSGLTSTPENVIGKIIGAEGGQGGVRNPASSATGLGQFIDSTWLSTVKRHAPDIAQGKSDEQLLALRKDDDFARQMLVKHTEDNQQFLASRGLPSTDRNTYLAHFLGANGAVPVLTADPNTPITQVVSNAVIAANRAVFKSVKTVGDLLAWAERKMG